MARADWQRLSKDALIDLVLRLQRPDKTRKPGTPPIAAETMAPSGPPCTARRRWHVELGP